MVTSARRLLPILFAGLLLVPLAGIGRRRGHPTAGRRRRPVAGRHRPGQHDERETGVARAGRPADGPGAHVDRPGPGAGDGRQRRDEPHRARRDEGLGPDERGRHHLVRGSARSSPGTTTRPSTRRPRRSAPGGPRPVTTRSWSRPATTTSASGRRSPRTASSTTPASSPRCPTTPCPWAKFGLALDADRRRAPQAGDRPLVGRRYPPPGPDLRPPLLPGPVARGWAARWHAWTTSTATEQVDHLDARRAATRSGSGRVTMPATGAHGGRSASGPDPRPRRRHPGSAAQRPTLDS